MSEKKLQTKKEFDECKKNISRYLKEAIDNLKLAKKECQELVCANRENLIGKGIQEEIYRLQEIEVNYLKPLNKDE